jgi:quinol monooxygenase YgiN
MINVIATIKITPGTRDEFVKIFNANVPAVLAEDGCIEYFPAIDVDSGLDNQNKDENAVVVIEKWETLEHLHAHLTAPHMISFREKAGDMIAGLSLKILKQA